MTPEDKQLLDDAEARHQAATAGDWRWLAQRVVGRPGEVTADLWAHHYLGTLESVADAEFCCGAKRDVPALLALVRRQEAEIERLRAHLFQDRVEFGRLKLAFPDAGRKDLLDQQIARIDQLLGPESVEQALAHRDLKPQKASNPSRVVTLADLRTEEESGDAEVAIAEETLRDERGAVMGTRGEALIVERKAARGQVKIRLRGDEHAVFALGTGKVRRLGIGWQEFTSDSLAPSVADQTQAAQAEAERRIIAALAVQTEAPLSVRGLSGTLLEIGYCLHGINSPTDGSAVSEALNERIARAERQRDAKESETATRPPVDRHTLGATP